MKQYVELVKQMVLSVLVQRIAGYAADQYLMPLVEKLPTRKRKPFGFGVGNE